VEVVVLKVDGPGRRLGLGLKQALGNPWDTVADRYPPGKVVEGKVTRLAKFGAFVEVEEGIEGMIHVSEFTHERRVEHPSEMVKIGEMVRAVVLAADSDNKRLKLGMKQLEGTTADEFLAEHKAGDRVTGRVLKIAGRQATIQLGEGVEGVCALTESAPVVAGTMAAALAAAWKGGASTAASGPEPLREGQLRTFTIVSLDPQRIELSVA
jgi:small subunit ribosomal protein S1